MILFWLLSKFASILVDPYTTYTKGKNVLQAVKPVCTHSLIWNDGVLVVFYGDFASSLCLQFHAGNCFLYAKDNTSDVLHII